MCVSELIHTYIHIHLCTYVFNDTNIYLFVCYLFEPFFKLKKILLIFIKKKEVFLQTPQIITNQGLWMCCSNVCTSYICMYI